MSKKGATGVPRRMHDTYLRTEKHSLDAHEKRVAGDRHIHKDGLSLSGSAAHENGKPVHLNYVIDFVSGKSRNSPDSACTYKPGDMDVDVKDGILALKSLLHLVTRKSTDGDSDALTSTPKEC